MRYVFAITGLLFMGCSLTSQTGEAGAKEYNLQVQEGIVLSLGDLDLANFKIEYEELQVLEDYGISLDSLTKEHLLCFAVDQCDQALLTFLIDKGADPNCKCDGDAAITYIAYCVREGVEMTKTMIAHGANKNGADQDNDSYLSYAISYDNHNLVRYLLQIDADREQKDLNPNMGCLPVHACRSLEMLKLLLANDFDINAICDNGRNLLHFAAKDDLVEIAQYIIMNNLMDFELKDKNGETPLDYAIRYANPKIEHILRSLE